ncbi:uncharacterized protein LOC112611600 [Theropithecus gelada]|uniref:uncharacterized protein LOC112611600 n=1 Tax=Theropithecus gelada TaxID=9565 RepID=UPI000DC168D5|nr:uncharacterized protein LOC112611600 [Theropithecus gelada]
MARAGDPGLPGLLPAPSRASARGHLPLASEPRRQGRKHKSGSAARPSDEEAPLPAPTRQQESSGFLGQTAARNLPRQSRQPCRGCPSLE